MLVTAQHTLSSSQEIDQDAGRWNYQWPRQRPRQTASAQSELDKVPRCMIHYSCAQLAFTKGGYVLITRESTSESKRSSESVFLTMLDLPTVASTTDLQFASFIVVEYISQTID